MKKMRFLRAFLSLAVFFLVSCSASIVSSIGECLLPPVATVPATMETHREQLGYGVIHQGGIPPWWNVQPNSSSPFSITPKNNPSWWEVNDIAIQNDNVIWVALSIFQYDTKDVNEHYIVRYDLSTGVSHSYQIVDDAKISPSILDLFFTRDGDLWVLTAFPQNPHTALVHYNSERDQFEFISFVSGEKLILQPKDNGNYAALVRSPILVESSDRNILLPFGKNIISYNPLTHQAKQLLPDDFPAYISSILVYENKVWFTVNGGFFDASSIDHKDRNLRSVDIQTGELVNYGYAPSILNDDPSSLYFMDKSYRSIAVDRFGRIWMGYFARLTLEQDGTYSWEKITYPPELVVADDPDYQYMWARTYSIFTSSDGSLWFTTTAGLIEYDPSLNKWCRSTPIPGVMALAQDNKGNLWMAEDKTGYLYKHKLKP